MDIKKRNPVGRPTKWTEENRKNIIIQLENGATHKRAAILAGVGESTFAMWKNRGIKDNEAGEETEYTKFLEQIDKACERYITFLQSTVNKACQTDGRLALEVLERKRPDEFGKKNQLAIKGQFDVSKFDVKLSKEQEEAYEKRLKEFWAEAGAKDIFLKLKE